MLIYLTLIEAEEEKRKFERIYINYKQTMYCAAFRILKNVHSAEDAVHQAFMRVIDNLEKINENDCHKTRGFLVIITEHIAIDILRKIKRENTVSFDELECYILENTLQEYEEENEVLLFIEKLPVNYCAVLRLKFSQGFRDIEIAQILNITEENVRQRISRAKKKLGQILKKEGKFK